MFPNCWTLVKGKLSCARGGAKQSYKLNVKPKNNSGSGSVLTRRRNPNIIDSWDWSQNDKRTKTSSAVNLEIAQPILTTQAGMFLPTEKSTRVA